MEEREIKLLKQIKSGVMIFEPSLRTSAELTRFQETARLLLGLEGKGLIYKCFVTEFEIAGVKYYDSINIPRGLTLEGEEALAGPRGIKFLTVE